MKGSNVFDIWYKIMEEGAVAMPASPSELSALEWCEVGEKYPHRVHEYYYKDMWQGCEKKRMKRRSK